MQSKPLKSLSTLIVDSSHAVMNFASAILKQDFGINKIQKMSSPITALELLRTETKIDLLFLDINTPEIDGMQLLEELASLNYQGYLVLISGVAPQIISSVEQAIRCFELKYLGTLLKPLSAQQFLTLLRPIASTQTDVEQQTDYELKIYQLIRSLNNGELQLRYQPRIDIKSSRITSVEVLLMLNKAAIEIVTPAQLLAKVEQNGLQLDVTSIILRQVFRDWLSWKKVGLELNLSIDIGCAYFQTTEFVVGLEKLLTQFGIAKQQISFTISYKMLVKNSSELLSMLSQFSSQGLKFSLSDINSNAIAQITRLPITELIFTNSALTSNNNKDEYLSFAESGKALAKHLDIVTLVTSIDTSTDYKLCEQLGCTQAQGLYLSEPILAKDVVARMANWKFKTK